MRNTIPMHFLDETYLTLSVKSDGLFVSVLEWDLLLVRVCRLAAPITADWPAASLHYVKLRAVWVWDLAYFSVWALHLAFCCAVTAGNARSGSRPGSWSGGWRGCGITPVSSSSHGHWARPGAEHQAGDTAFVELQVLSRVSVLFY